MRSKSRLTVLFLMLCLAWPVAPAAGARNQPQTTAAPGGASAHADLPAGLVPHAPPTSVEQMQAPAPRLASYNAVEDMGQATIVVPGVYKDFYTWNTLLSIQNLTTATMPVTVEIHYDTTYVLTSSVPAHSPWHLDLADVPSPPPLVGVATVSAPGPIAVTVLDKSITSLTAYDGLFDAATELFVPVLYYSYHGWDSVLSVHNAGAVTTTVVVNYSDGLMNSAVVPPGGFRSFRQDSEGHAPGSTFSAVATADQPLLGYSRCVCHTGGESTQEAFTGGGDTVAVPLTTKGYAGWDSAVVAQNLGSLTTSVTIAYEGYAADAYSVTLGGGGTYVFSTTAEPFLPLGYHGAAQLSSDNAQPLIAQVLLSQAAPTVLDPSASYHGVAAWGPGGAAAEEHHRAQPTVFEIHYPLAPRPLPSAHDWWDAFLVVENVGTSEVTVTAEFYDAGGTSYMPADLGGFPNPFTLEAGASQVISMSAIPESGLPSGENYAVVISSDQPIAGVAVLGHGLRYQVYLPLVPKAYQP